MGSVFSFFSIFVGIYFAFFLAFLMLSFDFLKIQCRNLEISIQVWSVGEADEDIFF